MTITSGDKRHHSSKTPILVGARIAGSNTEFEQFGTGVVKNALTALAPGRERERWRIRKVLRPLDDGTSMIVTLRNGMQIEFLKIS